MVTKEIYKGKDIQKEIDKKICDFGDEGFFILGYHGLYKTRIEAEFHAYNIVKYEIDLVELSEKQIKI